MEGFPSAARQLILGRAEGLLALGRESRSIQSTQHSREAGGPRSLRLLAVRHRRTRPAQLGGPMRRAKSRIRGGCRISSDIASCVLAVRTRWSVRGKSGSAQVTRVRWVAQKTESQGQSENSDDSGGGQRRKLQCRRIFEKAAANGSNGQGVSQDWVRLMKMVRRFDAEGQ